MAKPGVDEQIEKISAWLRKIHGDRLLSLLVYGSAADGGNHHPKHSDINLLAVFDRIDAGLLEASAAAIRWWEEQGNPPPAMFTRDEIRDAADVFPIEYLDIREHHRLLLGADLVASTPHFREQHRLQVEHDLRAKLMRLRARYPRAGSDARALEALLMKSFSSMVTLLRHALVAVGQSFIIDKNEVIAAAAGRFSFDPSAWQAILHARRSGTRLADGKLPALRELFAGYLDSLQRVERELEGYGRNGSH